MRNRKLEIPLAFTLKLSNLLKSINDQIEPEKDQTMNTTKLNYHGLLSN